MIKIFFLLFSPCFCIKYQKVTKLNLPTRFIFVKWCLVPLSASIHNPRLQTSPSSLGSGNEYFLLIRNQLVGAHKRSMRNIRNSWKESVIRVYIYLYSLWHKIVTKPKVNFFKSKWDEYFQTEPQPFLVLRLAQHIVLWLVLCYLKYQKNIGLGEVNWGGGG